MKYLICDCCDREEGPPFDIGDVCPCCCIGKFIKKEFGKMNKDHRHPIIKEFDTLDEAKKTICKDRMDQYGKPEDSFKIIADFWNIYLKNKNILHSDMGSIDVAHMMTLFKISRMLGQKPHRDNYVDGCGYLAIAADRIMEWEE